MLVLAMGRGLMEILSWLEKREKETGGGMDRGDRE